MKEQRLHFFIISILAILVLYQYNKEDSNKTQIDKVNKDISEFKPNTNQLEENIESFKKIGENYGLEEVTIHHYENLYGSLLGNLRNQNINLLEIGLGCGQFYGTGQSVFLWRDYLAMANISILEQDAKCAEPFLEHVKHLFIGDQNDKELLKKIGEQAGPFDVIIDDGSHRRSHQIISLVGLWPYLKKKGGLYVIQDTYYSFIESYNDNQESSLDLIMQLILLLNFDSQDLKHIRERNLKMNYPNKTFKKYAVELSKDLMSVNCFSRACALMKN